MGDKQPDQLFTVGEFARLTGIPKQTLQFYDNKGIFSPAVRLENQYRYYEAEQYESIDIIYSLKEAGVSLGDIRDYLENRTPERCEDLLEREAQRVRDKIGTLERTLRQLEQKKHSIQRGLSVTEKHVLQIVEMPQRHLMTWDFSNVSHDGFFQELIQMINYCYDNGFYTGYTMGSILEKKHLLEKNYAKISWMFLPLDQAADHPYYRCQNAGLYATYYFEGSYDELPFVYHDIVVNIDDLGYEIIGDSFESGLLDFFSTRDEEKYLTEIAIPVSKKE